MVVQYMYTHNWFEYTMQMSQFYVFLERKYVSLFVAQLNLK